MIVRIIENTVELVALMLCAQKISLVKYKSNVYSFIFMSLEILLVELINTEYIPQIYRSVIWILFGVYLKMQTQSKWIEIFKINTISIFMIVCLQIVFYYLLRILNLHLLLGNYKGIFINLWCCIGLWIVDFDKLRDYKDKLNLSKGMIVLFLYMIPMIHILYISNSGKIIDSSSAIQFIIESVGLGIVAFFWINAEIRNKNKEKEILMYELYNGAFEDTIRAIRSRQHEFNNQINAIMCLQYTIENPQELLEAQRNYCNKIIEENDINNVLKIKMNPVIIGFLYSKISLAEEKGINVKYKILPMDIKMPIYEIIDILGVLTDNAMEALETSEHKVILINLQPLDENHYMIEVANSSRVFLNSELEMFCKYGYSTKGKKRGIGLSRVKDIVKKNHGIMQIENKEYNGKNYISFKIEFDNK